MEHKLLKIQFPLLLEGNFIPGAKQLKYKQASTFDQIWFRLWSLKMGPVTNGKSPQKAEHPFSPASSFAQRVAPLRLTPRHSLSLPHWPRQLDLQLSSPSLVDIFSGSVWCLQPSQSATKKPYQCTHETAGCRKSSHLRFGSGPVHCARSTARVGVLKGFDEQDAPNY